uniref:transposase n=1 Tax=Bifidobacterium longum TaxID=216816 RepID=UPI00359C12C3
MWHRDWLEEQRTGVPSTRGERYARYTTEQKRAAVDHYLTHGRRASRTMRRLGYPSKEVLAAWIDELASGERHVRRGPGPRRAQTPGSTPATATGLPTP